MTRARAAVLLFGLYVLHQDFWFWTTARPIVFGVFPIGLFYHVVFTLSTSLVLWFLVRAWLPAADSPDPDR
jgi:hypothetical protein